MQLFAELAPRTWLAFVFVFGAIWGSFLNVVIARLPEGLSVVSPPSRCPRCGKQIAWYDNLPVLSWLWLRARCRGCALPISARYPLVEALTGGLALLIAVRFGPTPPALAFFVLAALLVALAFIDLDTFWLPAVLSVPLLALGLLSPLWNPELGATFAAYGILEGRPLLQAFAASASGAALGAALLWSVGKLGSLIFRKEAMGLGDVLLLGGIGAWLGVQSLFFVIMFASLQGSALGLLLLLRRRRAPPDDERPPLPGATPDPAHAASAGGTASPPPPAIAGADIDTETDTVSVTESAAAIDLGTGTGAITAAAAEDWEPDPHHVPFGPFLALAALEQLLFGDQLWSAWMGMMNGLWTLIDRLSGRG